MLRGILLGAVAALGLLAGRATASEPITAYCPMSEDDCRSVLAAFKRDTGHLRLPHRMRDLLRNNTRQRHESNRTLFNNLFRINRDRR